MSGHFLFAVQQFRPKSYQRVMQNQVVLVANNRHFSKIRHERVRQRLFSLTRVFQKSDIFRSYLSFRRARRRLTGGEA